MINGIQISLSDNKKNNAKIYGNSKPKKEVNINGNYYQSNNNNNNNINTNNIPIPNRATQRKSSMNYVRKNNFNKEFNGNHKIKNNLNKIHKKNYNKEKNKKDDYHNVLSSPIHTIKNNKI